MTKITSLHAIAGALLACGLSAAPAAALSNRTWVSGHGTDSGACGTVTAPCKTFAFALSQTAAGGLIVVLDPSGYGPVTITKAISILNDGVGTAGIGASSGNAITINAGASESVHLRGLTIEGLGTGSNGILFKSGKRLAIENCVVRNFARAGILISPSTSSSFSVFNTIASNNGSSGGAGIKVEPTGSAVVTGVLGKVITNDNIFEDIEVSGSSTTGATLNVTVVDSEASNNGNAGVEAISTSGHAATAVMVRNVVASYNGVGLDVGSNAILRIAHSVVTGNSSGLDRLGATGTLYSYGDNEIDGNTFNSTSLLDSLAMH